MKPGDYQTFKKAQDYHDNRFKDGLVLVSQDELNTIKESLLNLNLTSPKVLDIASGTGRIIPTLLEISPKTLLAIDQSPAMLKQLEKTYNKEVKQGTVKTIQGNSESLPFRKESFDLLTSLHLFKHLANISPTLKEAYRVLKPNGIFIFDVLNNQSIIRFNLTDCYAINPTQIDKLLAKEGFKVERKIYLHALGETIYNQLGRVGASLFHQFDNFITSQNVTVGTKILILARKK